MTDGASALDTSSERKVRVPSRRQNLLAGTAFAGGVFALITINPQAAWAECSVASNAVTCSTTEPTNDSTNTNGTQSGTPPDRQYDFTTGGDVTASITSGTTISGYGLAITSEQSGAAISVINNGTVTLTTGTPSAGGGQVFDITSNNGNISYSGNGSVTDPNSLAASANGFASSLTISSGTGNVTIGSSAAPIGGNYSAGSAGYDTALYVHTTTGNTSAFLGNGTYSTADPNGNAIVFWSNSGAVNSTIGAATLLNAGGSGPGASFGIFADTAGDVSIASAATIGNSTAPFQEGINLGNSFNVGNATVTQTGNVFVGGDGAAGIAVYATGNSTVSFGNATAHPTMSFAADSSSSVGISLNDGASGTTATAIVSGTIDPPDVGVANNQTGADAVVSLTSSGNVTANDIGIQATTTGAGNVTVTTDAGSAIYQGTNGGTQNGNTTSFGGIVTSAESGTTSITVGGLVEAAANGVNAISTGGAITVSIGPAGSITAGATGVYSAVVDGNNNVVATGNITHNTNNTAGNAANGFNSGIFATSSGSGNIGVSTAAGTAISDSGGVGAQGAAGILAVQQATATGSIQIVNNATITGSVDAIAASILNTLDPSQVAVTSNGSVSGTRTGIAATTEGLGSVTVSVGNGGAPVDTTGGANGIFAGILNANSAGDVTVSVNGNVTGNGVALGSPGALSYSTYPYAVPSLNPTGYGVFAYNAGVGNVTVHADGTGTITSGGGGGAGVGVGIRAYTDNTASSGNILVTSNEAIVAPTTGIIATTAGSGAVTVETTGNGTISAAAGAATTGDGIDATITNAGSSGTITVNATGAINAGGIGINAANSGNGDVTVTAANILAARDAFIGRTARTLRELPAGAVLGTASLRRQALARRLRPDLRIVPLRGNVETRLRKLHAGEVDATLLAVAGLKRLGLLSVATELLDVDEFVPAVGQGAIGIESRAGDASTSALLARINDADTASALAAERAFLAALDGSCRTPIGGYARLASNLLRFRGIIIKPDGSEAFEVVREGGRADAAALGHDAGDELKRRAGSDFFLRE